MKNAFEYIGGDSFLHRLNPLTKLAVALLICVACFSSSNLIFLCAVIAVDIALGFCGGAGKRALRMFIGIMKFSVMLFVLQLLLIRSGEPLFYLIPPRTFPITDRGLFTSALVVLRLAGATLPLGIMLSFTRQSDLSNALVYTLRLPYKYAFALSSAIRFIPQFGSDLDVIIEAQTARGVDFDTKNPFKKVSLIVPLCVPLLVSSVKKTDTAAVSAELRGFELRTRESCSNPPRFSGRDFVALFGVAALTAAGMLI